MVKFLFFAQFPVDYLSHPVVSTLILFLHLLIACDSLFHLYLHITYSCHSFTCYQFSLGHKLVFMALFCAAVKRLIFSLEVSPSKTQVFSCAISPVCRLNNPDSYFSSHFCLLFFFFFCGCCHYYCWFLQSFPSIYICSWPRERAIDFILNYTEFPRSQVEIEVDRYITWPGQACSYKLGEIKIKELRRKAETELGKTIFILTTILLINAIYIYFFPNNTNNRLH